MSAENTYEQFYLGQNKFPDIPISLPEVAHIPDYVVIEGNSGAGKTTTVNIVAEETNFPHIGEYGNYINFSAGESFPLFPPQSSSDVIQTNTLWAQLEFRRRSHQLSSNAKTPNIMQLVERSPISLVAFEYAKRQQGIPSEIDHLLGLYSKLYEVGILKEPNGYVFIKVSPEFVKERIKLKGNNPTLEFLCSDKTISSINEFMDKFFTKYIYPDNFIILDSDRTSQTEMANKIAAFIKKLGTNSQPTNGIIALAHNSLIGECIF